MIVPIDTYFENRFFLVNRALDYPEVFKKDRDLFWRLRPSQTIQSRFFEGKEYRINSYGLRGAEISGDNAVIRIIGLGNSCTFGWGVTDEITYLKQFEKLINDDSNLPSVQVINAGIPGYSSFQGKLFLEEKILPLEPDMVLIMFGWNDQWAAAGNIADKDQEFPPQVIIGMQNLLSRLELYRVMKKVILSLTEEPLEKRLAKEDIVYRVDSEDFYENLKEMIKLCREEGILPVVLTSPIPNLETYYPSGMKSPMHQYHEFYNDLARIAAMEGEAPMIDIARDFDQYVDLYDDAPRDPIHFNAKGHGIAAELIYEYFKQDAEILESCRR